MRSHNLEHNSKTAFAAHVRVRVKSTLLWKDNFSTVCRARWREKGRLISLTTCNNRSAMPTVVPIFSEEEASKKMPTLYVPRSEMVRASDMNDSMYLLTSTI